LIDHEASIAVALFVERGGAGISLSGGLGVVVEDDAVGEVAVGQYWLLIAGAVGLEKDRADTVPVLDQALAIFVVDQALANILSTDVHGYIGSAPVRGKRVQAEDVLILKNK